MPPETEDVTWLFLPAIVRGFPSIEVSLFAWANALVSFPREVERANWCFAGTDELLEQPVDVLVCFRLHISACIEE